MHGAVESMEDMAELGLGGTPPIFAATETDGDLTVRVRPSSPAPRSNRIPCRAGDGTAYRPGSERPAERAPDCARRARPAPVVHPRDRHPVGADRGARHHRAQRGDPHDPARPAHHAAEPAVGDHRVLTDVREPADHRRPARRPLRRPADLHHRRGAVRRGLAARVPRPVGAGPDLRRGDHRGHRRLAHDARHARHPLVDLPRSRARHGVRDVGGDGGRGRGASAR